MKLRFFRLLPFILLPFLLCGCEDREVSKKVSLERRIKTAERDNGTDNLQADAGTLKFGFDLRLGPKEDVRIYLPFLKYLEQNSGNRFSIRFTEKYEDTVENLGNGITQFAALGPVNCVLAKEKYGAGCLVMGLNSEGKPEYRAVIFTKIDSPIKNLKDLKGKTFAFGDRRSTQGHIIPRKMLEDAGITPANLKGYSFTGSHTNTARAVLNGEYDAGGIQDNLAKRLVKEGNIKVIAVSKPYPSSLICYSKYVDPLIIKAVKSTLLSFDPKNRHRKQLVDWDKTEMPNGFTEFNSATLEEIKTLTYKYGLLK